MRRSCSSSAKRVPSSSQSLPYNHSPSRSFPPSLSSLPPMSLEQQPTTTSQAPTKVSSLARRIHGWSWQAVCFLQGSESCHRRCPDAFFLPVPHRNGYRVGRPSPRRTSWFPIVEYNPKRRLSDPFRSQEPVERPFASRTCILLPQHRVVSVEYLKSDIAALLYAPYFRGASRLLTMFSVNKSFRVSPCG